MAFSALKHLVDMYSYTCENSPTYCGMFYFYRHRNERAFTRGHYASESTTSRITTVGKRRQLPMGRGATSWWKSYLTTNG